MDEPRMLIGKPGEPVSEVDSDDIKALWNVYREAGIKHPGQQFALGFDFIKSTCKPGANVQAVWYRTAMLEVLLSVVLKEQLGAWIANDNPHEGLFRAAAQTRMEWMGEGERRTLPLDIEEFLRRARGEST